MDNELREPREESPLLRISRLEKRIEVLEYRLSETLSRKGSSVEPEDGWREVYRFHPPSYKDDAMRLTTQERREGHVIEHGYILELRDVAGEEPVLRIKRIGEGRQV